ncbi:MAG: hypothetical protein A3K83_06870 [Omnitrophica WOR_2 bacterium RBG_13_44_8b]|nr:MAG: hypothetical protein A3K83_06870 [Omnitrophica WOR_2 bacterium RBG_13_44_8b]
MRQNKFFMFFLMVLFISVPMCLYAKDERVLSLNGMLTSLTNPRLTSLQKMTLIDGYKSTVVKGAGKVKDVLISYGSENETLVCIQKPFRGKEYEVVLLTSRESAEKIQKGNTVGFEGTFVAMAFETLRFKDVKIIRKSRWPF